MAPISQGAVGRRSSPAPRHGLGGAGVSACPMWAGPRRALLWPVGPSGVRCGRTPALSPLCWPLPARAPRDRQRRLSCSRPDRRLTRGAGGQARRKAWGHTQVWSGVGEKSPDCPCTPPIPGPGLPGSLSAQTLSWAPQWRLQPSARPPGVRLATRIPPVSLPFPGPAPRPRHPEEGLGTEPQLGGPAPPVGSNALLGTPHPRPLTTRHVGLATVGRLSPTL